MWTEAIYADPDSRKIHQKRRWKGGFKTKTAALAFAAAPVPDEPKRPTLRAYWNSWHGSDYKDLSKSKQPRLTLPGASWRLWPIGKWLT